MFMCPLSMVIFSIVHLFACCSIMPPHAARHPNFKDLCTVDLVGKPSAPCKKNISFSMLLSAVSAVVTFIANSLSCLCVHSFWFCKFIVHTLEFLFLGAFWIALPLCVVVTLCFMNTTVHPSSHNFVTDTGGKVILSNL